MKPQSSPIALHYNPFYGPDLYGTWSNVFRLPLLGLIVFFAHFTLAAIFYQKERLAAHLLMGVACVFQIFLLMSMLTIYYINLPGN